MEIISTMKKRLITIFFMAVMALCLLLPACSKNAETGDLKAYDYNVKDKENEEVSAADPEVKETGKDDAGPADNEPNTESKNTKDGNQKAGQDTPSAAGDSAADMPKENGAAPAGSEARYAAYKNIMLDFVNNNYLPGYGDLTEIIMSNVSGITENEFAVADVDADGRDELVVYFLTSAVAGHIGIIYDCNEETGECFIELKEYPLFSFYENGTIEAGWSHNQGYAGDFWPYTLYVHDKESDIYNAVGYVDAYDRNLYEYNREALESRPYPYDIDKDNNGFVYYLYDYENALRDYQQIEAVDDDAYQSWLLQYTEGTGKTTIEFHEATEENVSLVFGN